MYPWNFFWKILESFLGEIFEEVLQGNTRIPKEVFKNISELFLGNMFLEKTPEKLLKKLMEKFLRKPMDKFLKNSQQDSQKKPLLEYFVEEIPGVIPGGVFGEIPGGIRREIFGKCLNYL